MVYNRGVMKSICTLILCLLLGVIISGCSTQESTTIPTPQIIQAGSTPTISPTDTSAAPSASSTPTLGAPLPTQDATPSLTETVIPTAKPAYVAGSWKDMPVVPVINKKVKDIYQRGLQMGNNPKAFAKIGDCGSTPAWFLGDFDREEKYYNLGDYQYLGPVIGEFQGSFSRTSLAAKSGFNASSIFAPLWADRNNCMPNESPLACEYRNHRPVIAFIMLGSNDVWHQDTFEPQMRKIIEYSIENGVIPILSTKADNLEEDFSINDTIARLSVEYAVPLWNYWRAVQSLPDHGLQEDQVHITWGPNRFNDVRVMEAGWPVRNLTALQVLDELWRFINTP